MAGRHRWRRQATVELVALLPVAMAERHRSLGQATVELVAMLPLAVAAGLAAATILAHAAAQEHAAEAARAGAMALLQDEDARAAARGALPADERGAATIELAGRRIEVSLPPAGRLRAVLPHLTASASADAGPEPAP